jgi:hypothetical protein
MIATALADHLPQAMFAESPIAPTSVSGNAANFRIGLPKEEHNLESETGRPLLL